MVFKAVGARTFKLKLSIPTRNGGKPRTFSTGTTVKAVAQDVERMVQRMKNRREWEPIEAVFDGHMMLAEVYDAEMRGTLADRLAALRDVDLDPLVTEWAKQANAKYVTQVRVLITDGARFPASQFRRKRISEFLAGLTCADPTKNRYRAALSVFAKWLVEREVLDTNPVRDVAMYAENDPRMIWMTWPEAKRVVDAIDLPEYAEMIAIMAATGMELGAALELTSDSVLVDKTENGERFSIHANGTKTGWRNRIVIVEDWATPYLQRARRRAVGAGKLFPDATQDRALDVFQAGQKAAGIGGHRLHDLRHTYAVNALRKGYKPAVVAHQLGHKDSTMVTRVYGRFVPDRSDYETKVTNPATTTSRRTRGKRA